MIYFQIHLIIFVGRPSAAEPTAPEAPKSAPVAPRVGPTLVAMPFLVTSITPPPPAEESVENHSSAGHPEPIAQGTKTATEAEPSPPGCIEVNSPNTQGTNALCYFFESLNFQAHFESSRDATLPVDCRASQSMVGGDWLLAVCGDFQGKRD